jgi:RecB family exonuclease
LAAAQPFSHSRLTLLDQCPRQYRFRYVERQRESFRSIEAFCGTQVHDALGWLYREREERSAPDAAALARRFHELWDERLDGGVKVVREGTAVEEYREDGEALLRRHHAGPFAEDRRQTLSVEEKVALDVDGRRFVGYVDRLARDAYGTLHVIDYKTARRLPEDADAAALQVRGYGAAVLETRGGARVELELDYLRHDHRQVESLARAGVAGVTGVLADRIATTLAAEAAGDFPARPSGLCAWCGFRDRCDASSYFEGPRPAPVGADPGACPDCGRPLALRRGRRGRFVGCSGYPECRHARDARPEELPPEKGDGRATCPDCGAALARRQGSRGAFYGCAAFPRCRWTRDATAEDGP